MNKLHDAIQNAIKNSEEDPSYITNIKSPIESFFKINVMSPAHQPVFSSVIEKLGIPVKFEFDTYSYGAYRAQVTELNNNLKMTGESIVISTMFYELMKNSQQYGAKKTEEMIFVYLHELFHARFRHLLKQKMLAVDYPLPHVVYNIVFDIMINTLIKYMPEMASRYNIESSLLFANSMRYYSSAEDLQVNSDSALEILNNYGVSAHKTELLALQFLTNERIEKLTDEELAQVLYRAFDDFFDTYQKLFDEAMQEALSENNNQEEENNNANNSAHGQEDQGSETNSTTPQEDENQQQKQSDLHKKILKKFDEKLKDEAANNKDFAQAMKKFVANFNDLPNPNIQVTIEAGAKGGPMNAHEIAEAVQSQKVMQEIVEKIEEKTAGKIPGMLRSFANVRSKRASYISQLKAFARRNMGFSRKTFSPPNKKHSRRNLLIPSKIGDYVEMAFIIDTSGSMSDTEILPVLGQIKALLSQLPQNSKTHLLFNDATLQYEAIRGKNTKKLEEILNSGVQGSGGSVFTDSFNHPSIRNADAIVFLSDFYIYYDENLAIKKPIVFLHTEKHNTTVLRDLENRARNKLTIPIGELE